MGNIRKQTIISSILVYIGFFIGFFNNYFYTSSVPLGFLPEGNIFTPGQYALTQMFFNASQIFMTFGAIGVMPVIYKFYPYYKDNLEENEIDLLGWALLFSFAGFLLVLFVGIYFQPLMVSYFSKNSSLFVDHYFWLFPLTAGTLFYSVTESFCWALNRAVVTNFLKETLMRLMLTVLIVLYCCRVIDFRQFIIGFSFQFFLIFLILLVYLFRTSGHLHIRFKISRVTRKFWKKMLRMQLLIFSGQGIAIVASSVDILIIGGLKGLTSAGIFGFAQYAANLIQVPQRSIQAVSAGILSRAWKDKDLKEISRIYSRSSINLLLMALLIFGNLWLNLVPAIGVFKIQGVFAEAISVVLILGVVRIIDAGTGLSQQVINSSNYWYFDFYSRIILLALKLPLAIFLINKYGIIGSAIAELASYSIYTLIDIEFIRRKFKMQPFSLKTLYSLLLATGAFALCYFTMNMVSGFIGLVLRAVTFSAIMIAGIFYLKLTPDAGQLYEVFLGRVDRFRSGRKKKIE